MLPLTELGHGRQGQPNGGVSEMGKQPHVRMESQRSTIPMQNAPTYQEAPTLTMKGWLYTLQNSKAKMTAKQK